MNDNQLLINIITPSSLSLSCQTSIVIIPGEDGEFGVLPKHMLLIANLDPGIIKITTDNGNLRYFIDGGVAQVTGTEVNIFTEFSVNLASLQKGVVEEKVNDYKDQLQKTTDKMHAEFIGINLARYETILKAS